MPLSWIASLIRAAREVGLEDPAPTVNENRIGEYLTLLRVLSQSGEEVLSGQTERGHLPFVPDDGDEPARLVVDDDEVGEQFTGLTQRRFQIAQRRSDSDEPSLLTGLDLLVGRAPRRHFATLSRGQSSDPFHLLTPQVDELQRAGGRSGGLSQSGLLAAACPLAEFTS